jgi:hypothetical protein
MVPISDVKAGLQSHHEIILPARRPSAGAKVGELVFSK